MSEGKYTKLIEDYCKKQGFVVPSGFNRRAASPLAVVMTDVTPPKLVARTWFNKEDVVYFLENIVMAESDVGAEPPVRVFDFKAHVELEYTGSKRLRKKVDFETIP